MLGPRPNGANDGLLDMDGEMDAVQVISKFPLRMVLVVDEWQIRREDVVNLVREVGRDIIREFFRPDDRPATPSRHPALFLRGIRRKVPQ